MNKQSKYGHNPAYAGRWPAGWKLSDGLTTKEVAEKLGVGMTRVRNMIYSGMLPAHRAARDWFIHKKALEELMRNRRPAGRPRKDGKK